MNGTKTAMGWRRWVPSANALLVVPLLDELISGFPVIALPLVRDELALSYEQAGLLFTLAGLSAMVLEPPINLLSDRLPARRFFLGALLVLIVGWLVAAGAAGFAWLALGFALVWPAQGIVNGIAQTVLVELAPGQGTRTMTRWTILAAIGDLLAPAVVALTAALALGWRPLFGVAALLWLITVVALRHIGTQQQDDGAKPLPPALEMMASVRAAVRAPRLVRWTVIVLMSGMLDEVFLGFAALYLTDNLEAAGTTASLVLTALVAGSLAGLLVLDRFLSHREAGWLLRRSAVAAGVGVVLFLAAPSIWIAALGLFVTGFGAAPWYPVAKARAYAALPGRTGAVRAFIGLGAPFEVALPVVTGLIAGSAGLAVALVFLGLSSLVVLAAAGARAP